MPPPVPPTAPGALCHLPAGPDQRALSRISSVRYLHLLALFLVTHMCAGCCVRGWFGLRFWFKAGSPPQPRAGSAGSNQKGPAGAPIAGSRLVPVSGGTLGRCRSREPEPSPQPRVAVARPDTTLHPMGAVSLFLLPKQPWGEERPVASTRAEPHRANPVPDETRSAVWSGLRPGPRVLHSCAFLPVDRAVSPQSWC